MLARTENIEQIRHNWGLDDPLPEQYLRWLGNLASGDLGPSHSNGRPVTQVLAERAGWTLLLVGVGLVVLLVVSLAVGTLAAWRRDSRLTA
jgi:peptide/nickel transport system permease protein